MSEYVFKLPDLGEGTVVSEIGEWFINVGHRSTRKTSSRHADVATQGRVLGAG